MGNSIAIRTSAPGAKQAAGDIGMLKANISALGSKTGGPLGSMLGGMGGLGLASLGAGAGIGMLMGGIQTLGAALGDGVKSAMGEEKSLASLDAVLRANVPGWDGNREAIDENISANQKLGFSDDDLRTSLGKLLVSTRDVEDATRLQGIAMDLARLPGWDLAKATDAVMKANMGNIGALRRAGVNIDKNATSTEALAKLTEMSVGQAAAYAETLEGVFASADESLGEMQEHVGEKFLPLFKDMATTAKDDVIPAMEDLVDVLTQDAEWDNSFIMHALELMALLPAEMGGAMAAAKLAQIKVDDMGNAIIDRFTKTRDALEASMDGAGHSTAQHFGTGFNDTIKTIRFGKDLAPNLADELRDGVKNDIDGAMADVKYAIEHPLQLAKQTAQIEAALVTLNIKRGLASNTPEVNAVIDQQIQTLQNKWSDLTGQAYRYGVNASNALEQGLRTFNAPSFPVFGGKQRKKGEKKPAGENPGGGGRASGGPVRSGEAYTVGENGEETLVMGNQGGYIIPHGRGGAGGTGPIHVHVHLSTREFRGQSRHDGVIQQGAPTFR